MNVSMNVGAAVKVPLPFGWSADTSDPTIVSVSVVAGQLTLTALAAGSCWITTQFAYDLKASLQITVTP